MLNKTAIFTKDNEIISLVRLFIDIVQMKRSLTIISFLGLSFLQLPVFAQRKLTEATITYDITVNSDNAADMLDGSRNVIYIKSSCSRSEIISSLGKQSTLIDEKNKAVTILKEYGDKKYMITATLKEWNDHNKKYDSIRFSFLDEYKTISGYNCQKAIGKINDSTAFTVYFTRELIPSNKDFETINKNLPGLAMQYEAIQGKKLVTYTVSSINFNPVQQSNFDLPKSGFRVMTWEESKRGGN